MMYKLAGDGLHSVKSDFVLSSFVLILFRGQQGATIGTLPKKVDDCISTFDSLKNT